MKPTIEELTVAVETASRKLAEAVQAAYPIGATVRFKLPGREVRIQAVVVSHGWSLRYPHDIRVKNLKTGKFRNISVHPQHGTSVEIIALPQPA